MVRNAVIGLVAFVAGLLTAYVLSQSATTLPEVPTDRLSMRFDALDDAVATLDRTLRSETSRSHLGLLPPPLAEPDGSTLEQQIVLMREELHGILEALAASHEILPAGVGRQDQPRSAASYEVQQRSWDVVNDALAARRWTQKDARALFASWTELSLPQRQQLLGALYAAANRGEIDLEGENGLF